MTFLLILQARRYILKKEFQIKNKPSLLTLLLVFSLISPSFATTESKEKDIIILLEAMGISSMAEQMADAMVTMAITQEKKRNPNLPKNVEHALSQAIYDVVIENAHELDVMLIPLYDKYYTHKEINELIIFFNSTVGKKYSSVLMPMTQEMLPIAQKWGQKVGPLAAKRAEQELAKFGYK